MTTAERLLPVRSTELKYRAVPEGKFSTRTDR